MLMLSILFLLSSDAVTLRRDKSILYARVVITILISCFILCINSYYTDFHVKGLGLFEGLYQTTAITYIFHMFVILTTAAIMMFNINNKIKSGSFLENFKKFILLIWENGFNYILYLLLMCIVFYILNSSYTTLFNFNLESSFIWHIIKLYSMYMVFTIISSYTFTYFIHKKLIYFQDAIKSITFFRFVIITIWYFFWIYLGFNVYLLVSLKIVLSNIIVIVLDLIIQISKLHSLSNSIFKLSSNSITYNRTSKFTISNINSRSNSTINTRYKLLPLITLNNFYSNSIFNNVLYPIPGSNINTFLHKKLYISKPFKAVGLNPDFTIIKRSDQLYSKVNLGNNKYVVVSTNPKLVNLINYVCFSNNSNCNKLVHYKVNVMLNSEKVNIKKSYSFYDNHDGNRIVAYNNKSSDVNVQYNSNINVFMVRDIIYDNLNLRLTNPLSIEQCLSSLPEDDVLITSFYRDMTSVQESINSFKNFMLAHNINLIPHQSRLVIPFISDMQLNYRAVTIYNACINSVNYFIQSSLNYIYDSAGDRTKYKIVITWIYKEIGINFPIRSSTDIYQEYIKAANNITNLLNIPDIYPLVHELFVLDSERTNMPLQIIPKGTDEPDLEESFYSDPEESLYYDPDEASEVVNFEGYPSQVNVVQEQRNFLGLNVLGTGNSLNDPIVVDYITQPQENVISLDTVGDNSNNNLVSNRDGFIVSPINQAMLRSSIDMWESILTFLENKPPNSQIRYNVYSKPELDAIIGLIKKHPDAKCFTYLNSSGGLDGLRCSNPSIQQLIKQEIVLLKNKL